MEHYGNFYYLNKQIDDLNTLGRVVAEHKERYNVQTTNGMVSAEITGQLRYAATSRSDFPAVGDWVHLAIMDDGFAIILKVYPRQSLLQRQAVGKKGEAQLIAANIDVAFIMQSVGHDFNLNRIDRYLSICNSGGVQPKIILSKADLIQTNEMDDLLAQLKHRTKNVSVYAISSTTSFGLDTLIADLHPHMTYCLLGSSGVGKSTLLNALIGEEVMATSHISDSTSKGRHTTSFRQLIKLPNSSYLIDTPGMRELGMADAQSGIEDTYSDIVELAQKCRFHDCKHINEKECALLDAIENGELEPAAYESFMKLTREQAHYQSSAAEKRQKDKEFGKLIKRIQEEHRKHKNT